MFSKDFLKIYNEELHYLRKDGKKFAKEHPQVAKHLGVHSEGVVDPFVERLLEGTAFLSARVHERLDQEQPEIALQILSRLAPFWHAPTPSMSAIAISPDLTYPQWQKKTVIPKGSHLLMSDKSLGADTVKFTTACDLTIEPITITEASYTAIASNDLPNNVKKQINDGTSYLSFTLSTKKVVPLNKINLDPLTLTFTSNDVASNKLITLLLNNTLRIALWGKKGNSICSKILEKGAISLIGASDDDALLPVALGEIPGSRLLKEYFNAPFRFFGIKVAGVSDFLKNFESEDEFEIVFVLDKRQIQLIDLINKDDFRLFSVPIVNLYEKRCTPIFLDHTKTEHAVIVDKFNTSRYLIHHLINVQGILDNGNIINFSSLQFDAKYQDEQNRAIYAIRRKHNDFFQKNTNANLPREDLYISLSQGYAQDDIREIGNLSINALVCDRHFNPALLQSPQLTFDVALPIDQIELLRHPTTPVKTPNISLAWQVLQRLSVNPLSYTKDQIENNVEMFRDWLMLFADKDNPSHMKRILSLTKVAISHYFERYSGAGPIAWTRGISAELNLKSEYHSDNGVFLFGRILHYALSKYCEFNQSMKVDLYIDDYLTSSFGEVDE